MSKQGHKARTNLPAGGFLAIGRDIPSTSDSGRTKPLVIKRELPQVRRNIHFLPFYIYANEKRMIDVMSLCMIILL